MEKRGEIKAGVTPRENDVPQAVKQASDKPFDHTTTRLADAVTEAMAPPKPQAGPAKA